MQEADAADVSQEVLLRVSVAIRSFEYNHERGRFRSWLGVITANEIVSNWTRTNRIPHVETLACAAGTESDPEWNQEFTDHILSLAIDRIRGEFEDATWAIFEAVWMRNEPPLEIAARFGVGINLVYLHKSRVLKRLRVEVLKIADDLPIANC